MLKKRLLSVVLFMSIILSMFGGFAVQVSAAAGDTIQLSTDGGNQQKWYVTVVNVAGTDYRQFVSFQTGQALASVPSEVNGIGLVTKNINDDSQLWVARNIDNNAAGPTYGAYVLANKADGKVFYNDVVNGNAIKCIAYPGPNGECLIQFNRGEVLPTNDTYCTISSISWYAPKVYFSPVSTTDTTAAYESSIINAAAYGVTSETLNSQVSQKWVATKFVVNSKDYWTLTNRNTAKVLSYIRQIDNSVILTQVPYVNGDSAQLWEINLVDAVDLHHSIKNKLSNQYLSLGNGVDTAAGQGVKFVESFGEGSTLFQFSWTTVENGSSYNIMSVWPIFSIQGNGDAFSTSFPVLAQAASGQGNQKWKIDKITTVNQKDYYTLTNANTEKVLTYNSIHFTQESYVAGNEAQLWNFETVGNFGTVIINKSINANIILTNKTDDLAGGLTLFPWDSTWGYNSNGYGLWLFDGGLTFTNGSTYTLKSYSPNYYLQGDGAQSPSIVKVNNLIAEINNINLDLVKASDAAAINLIKATYDSFTLAEQAKVSNYNLLTKAIAALVPISAYSAIDAGESRIVTHGSNPLFGYTPDLGGLNYGIGYTTVGDKIAVPNVDFGSFGAATATINATGYAAGEEFGLYIDNDYNNLVGKFTLPLANNSNLYSTYAQTVAIDISLANLKGIHTVNIQWISSVGSFFSIEFKEKAATFGSFIVSDLKIRNISPSSNLTVSTLLDSITFASTSTYEFKNGTTILGNSDKAGTGTTLEVTNGQTTTYTIIVYGDVTGDGDVNVNDIVTVKQHLLKIQSLTNAKLFAAQMNNASSVTISDLLMIKKQALGFASINQNR